jgi:subtilisin family serine protease
MGLKLVRHGWKISALVLFAVLALAVSSPGQGAMAAVEQHPGEVAGLDTLAARAQQAGSVRVIIRLAVSYRPEARLGWLAALQQRAQIRQQQDRLFAGLGTASIRASHRFSRLPLVAVELDPEGVRRLAEQPNILSVQEDVPQPPLLAETIPLIGADDAWAAGFDGSGWSVAILDTGVATGHQAFSGKLTTEACFSGAWAPSESLCPNGQQSQTGTGAGLNCSTSIYGCDHGTHVAGIAVGDGSPAGVAPGAGLIPIQVFSEFSGSDCNGFGLPSPCALTWTTDQISALEWLAGVTSTFDIAAANMSLGGGEGYSSACDSDSRKTAIDALRAAGVATTIAAGNSGFTGSISAPACISSAISVGASTDSDTVAGYSNFAEILDLLAPGSFVFAPVPGNTYGTKSGTSMAAPHAAGVWAILKQAAPSASVDAILVSLINHGQLLTRSGSGYAKPRIQVDQSLTDFPAAPTATPSESVTPSPTATASLTSTPTVSPTATASPTSTSTPTATHTPTATPVFEDVPFDYWAHDYIVGLYDAGYVAGCSAEPRLYCPDRILNRAESSVFVLRGQYGGVADPPHSAPDSPTFVDVASLFWGYGWIESLWTDGFTAGCSADPLAYCPEAQHTRAEGSVFFLRVLNGVSYEPPAPVGLFDDVDLGAWYAGWAEAAYNAGLLPACASGPLRFCPEDELDRAWAAYMMVQAKGGLPLSE